MASTWNRIKTMLGMAIPTSMAVLAIGAGSAWAQTTYTFEGSDTLNDVIKGAISAWDTPANNPGGNHLTYGNVGSGQAEKNMQGANGTHPWQSIGPMSRNFADTVLSAHTDWLPSYTNVVALDAGIVSVGTAKGQYCSDITTALNSKGEGDGTSDLAIVLGGYSASGASQATTAQCAAPERLAALNRLTACQNANRIDHIYRRDDKSGTQDTFREKLGFSRWCNGKSEGNVNAAGSNLLNEDLDPIRRPCQGATNTKSATRCTFYPLNYPKAGDPPCTNGQTLAANDANNPLGVALQCTQGLVVALSENDPKGDGTGTFYDITKSIGNRVNGDGNALTWGLAGMASVDTAIFATNTGTRQNGTTYDYPNIRNGSFLMARKLFVQRNKNFAGDATRFATETSFFNYVSDKCKMLSIVQNAGFLSPIADLDSQCTKVCTDPEGTASGNIACFGMDVAGVGAPKMGIGAIGFASGTPVNGDVCGTAGYPWVQSGTACATTDSPQTSMPAQGSGSACSNALGCTGSLKCCKDSTGVLGTCGAAGPSCTAF